MTFHLTLLVSHHTTLLLIFLMAYEGGNRLKLSLSRNREYIDNDIQNIKFNINMNIQFDITYKNLKLLNPSGAGKTEL